jgi:hypothetical protein
MMLFPFASYEPCFNVTSDANREAVCAINEAGRA